MSRYGEKRNCSGLAFMTRKKTTILIYGVLILLAAALVTYGALINNSKKVSPPEQDYAEKLAELKADLIKAAAAGGEKQQTPGTIKRKPAGKSTKTGST
jgi:hypothetical protein